MPARLSAPPSELHLRPGETVRFRIGGAGSVGYRWTWIIDGEVGAITVAIEAAEPPPVPVPGVLRGGSVDQLVVIRGVRPGAARVHLELTRPVKSARGPLASYVIEVTVS
jgi:hypothetical protein